jgi:hypothetical protein
MPQIPLRAISSPSPRAASLRLLFPCHAKLGPNATSKHRGEAVAALASEAARSGKHWRLLHEGFGHVGHGHRSTLVSLDAQFLTE